MSNTAEAVCTIPGSKISYAWMEFLLPQDGVNFDHSANKSNLKWKNILNHIDGGWDRKLEKLPIPSGKKGSLQEKRSKRYKNITAFDVLYNGLRGTIAYGKIFEALTKTVDQEFYGEPTFNCSGCSVRPNIYVLSGHGAVGRIYGEEPGRSFFYLCNLKSYDELRILIIAACSQLSYSRATLLASLFKGKGILAILGYKHTYSGGAKSGKIMAKFIELLDAGQTILNAWKLANEEFHIPDSKDGNSFPWSAVVMETSKSITVNELEEGVPVRSERLMFYSYKEKDEVRDLEPLDTVSYLFFSKASSTIESLTTEILEFERQDVSFIVSTINATGDKLLGETVLVFHNAKNAGTGGIPELQKGEVIVFKFCVIRPDWNRQLQISSLFAERIVPTLTNGEISFPDDRDGNLMMLKITQNCTISAIPLILMPDVSDYLKERAETQSHGNPSDLVFHILRGVIDSSGNIVCRSGDHMQINDLKTLDWVNNRNSIDMKIFPAVI